MLFYLKQGKLQKNTSKTVAEATYRAHLAIHIKETYVFKSALEEHVSNKLVDYLPPNLKSNLRLIQNKQKALCIGDKYHNNELLKAILNCLVHSSSNYKGHDIRKY